MNKKLSIHRIKFTCHEHLHLIRFKVFRNFIHLRILHVFYVFAFFLFTYSLIEKRLKYSMNNLKKSKMYLTRD